MADLTAHTKHQIAYWRLASLKGQIHLESLGLKHSKGPLRPRIAAEFGLKPRSPHAMYEKAIRKKMDELLALEAARLAALDTTPLAPIGDDK